jgi:glycosyltransferase involved in cell wall biosynthesis
VAEALGSTDLALPGLLVPSGDARALAAAIAAWLDDGELRHRLRSAAAARRATLEPWTITVARVAAALHAAAGEPARGQVRVPG